MRRIVGSAFLALSLVTFSLNALAKDAGDRIHDTAVDAKKNARKTVRKGKRSVRKATGHNTLGDDIKDGAGNIHDSADAAKSKLSH